MLGLWVNFNFLVWLFYIFTNKLGSYVMTFLMKSTFEIVNSLFVLSVAVLGNWSGCKWSLLGVAFEAFSL